VLSSIAMILRGNERGIFKKTLGLDGFDESQISKYSRTYCT
jgi:hypothetical protein